MGRPETGTSKYVTSALELCIMPCGPGWRLIVFPGPLVMVRKKPDNETRRIISRT